MISQLLKILMVFGILAALSGCNDRDDPVPLTYAATIADARAAMQQMLADTNTPSASVALMDGERIIWSEAFGWIDRATQTAPSPTTLYGIGSVSKVLAAIAVMKLIDQGLIDLDAPLVRYLPDFLMASPEYSQITVRMLLNHSAGFGGADYRNGFTYVPIVDYAAQVQQTLATQRLKHQPGEMAVYCNDCFTMTERLIAAVSGRSYPQFVQEEILTPLGMTHSRFAQAPFPAGSFAPAYLGDQALPQEYTNSYASGGLYSTPSDMGRLALMLINGGQYDGVRILSEAAVAEMGRDQTGQLTFNPEPAAHWGLGWDGVAQPGLAAVGVTAWHKNGGTLHYVADFFVAPEARLAVMVTGASIPGLFKPGNLAERILLHALAERGDIAAVPTPLSETPQPEQPATDADLATMVGDYAQTAALIRVATAPDRTVQISTYSQGVWQKSASDLKRRVDGTFSSDAKPNESYWTLVANGQRYLAARRPGGLGHYLSAIPLGQQVQPAASLTDIWRQRTAQRWLAVNEDAQSILLVWGMPPRFTLNALDDLPGYLFANTHFLASRIVDPSGADTLARMFLKIPVSFGRDLNDVVIETRNGEDWVRYGSTLFRPQASIPELPTGDSTVLIGSEGLAEWRRLPVAGFVQIAGASAWKLYDADLNLLADDPAKGGSSGPAGAYLLLYGAPEAAITVTLTP